MLGLTFLFHHYDYGYPNECVGPSFTVLNASAFMGLKPAGAELFFDHSMHAL